MTNTIELDPPTTTRRAGDRASRCTRSARVQLFRAALGVTGMLLGDADAYLMHLEACEAHRGVHDRAGRAPRR